MKRNQRLQRGGGTRPVSPPQSQIVSVEEAQNAPDAPRQSSITWEVVPFSEVPPQRGPYGTTAKYKELEEALRKLDEGQSLKIPVPADKDPKKYASLVLNSVRKNVPGTRSRTVSTHVYFWVGETGPSRAVHSVHKGAA